MVIVVIFADLAAAVIASELTQSDELKQGRERGGEGDISWNVGNSRARRTAEFLTFNKAPHRWLRIMFGTKLRTWMEAHIVRSKKKKDRKGKGEKGFDSNSNSPRNHGSHRSAALHQVSLISVARCQAACCNFFSRRRKR